jgi:argininosuccinate lyase
VLGETAAAHRTTLMPDYTYLQHAQPTTLGHYLLGFAYPLARSLGRLERALELVNRCPAGAGSVNGSRFPIDRERLARSLRFDGVVTHTRDAMWAPDLPLTVLAELVAAMTTVDRLVEELELWATAEFGFVTLADRHCRTSVIMPQKKNPYALSMIRGHARSALGDYVAVVATNLTPSGQPDNRAASYERVPVVLRRCTDSIGLLAEVIAQIEFDTDRMAAEAASGFAYATDLCDYLVVETGIDNRTAHRIVGLAVRQAIDAGRTDLVAQDLAAAAAELDVTLPTLDPHDVDRQRDLLHLIDVRKGIGAAGAVDPMIDELSSLAAAATATYGAHPLLEFEAAFLDETRRFAEDL